MPSLRPTPSNKTAAHTYATIVCLALVACDGGRPFDPQSTRELQGRIVGGYLFTGLPAVGTLAVGSNQWCTATLIGPRTVLTAAHCLKDIDPLRLSYVTGSSLAQAADRVAVTGARPHPDYDIWSYDNDIATINLERQPTVAGEPVAPMRVVAHMDASWAGAQVRFVGYGVTDDPWLSTGSGVKRAVDIPIHRVQPLEFETRHQTHNTCSGDSGGPAFFKLPSGEHIIVGVTSHGDPWCEQFGLNTRVDPYLDFLGVEGVRIDAGGACGAETAIGRCDGDAAVRCVDEGVERTECGEGRACGVDTDGIVGCIDTAPDACAGIPDEGRCDGTVLVRCVDQQPHSVDCGVRGTDCGYDEHGLVAHCNARTDCGGETYEGRCENDSLIFCEGGDRREVACDHFDMRCGLNEAINVFDCIF